jgi:hypothetical protein
VTKLLTAYLIFIGYMAPPSSFSQQLNVMVFMPFT